MDFGTNLLPSNAAAFSLNEEDLREFKMAKTSSCGDGAVRFPPGRSNGCSPPEGMLSFSSPYAQPGKSPCYQYTPNAFGRNTGVRGPFTPSQWMELEHQALIYKYITANIPIPSYLLNPIRKAFDSAGFSLLRSNPLGWGGFQFGFSNTDPEPGRCRRTDGKKWRCSRDAVVDQKYCERHMNRGRHRSRKPVEPQPTKPTSNHHLPATPTVARGVFGKQKADVAAKEDQYLPHKHQTPQRQEFGLVCSDSLLNPLNRSSTLVASTNYNDDCDSKSQNGLRQFMDDWPKQLSISIPTPTKEKLQSSPSNKLEMGLGVGTRDLIPWEPTSIGGPLGEVLHSGIGDCSNPNPNPKQLNLIERWDNSPRLASSPTGVLQRGAFVSLSNSSSVSSPSRVHDGSVHFNGMINQGLMNPSLPAL